jgi:hypothetical protein
MKITATKIRYLMAVSDWSAPYEIAQRFGWSEAAGEKVKPYLGRLIGEGLVTWSRANNTYRITDAGRSALSRHPERNDNAE